MESNDKRAEEYASGMMGEPKEYWKNHNDITLFNTIQKAHKAGAINNVALDSLTNINSLKGALIEQIQRHDWAFCA